MAGILIDTSVLVAAERGAAALSHDLILATANPRDFTRVQSLEVLAVA